MYRGRLQFGFLRSLDFFLQPSWNIREHDRTDYFPARVDLRAFILAGNSHMPPLQYWFTGGALAAGLALFATVVTLGFAWYRAADTEMNSAIAKSEKSAEFKKFIEVREQLGLFLAEGIELLRLTRNEATPAPTEAAEDMEYESDLLSGIRAGFIICASLHRCFGASNGHNQPSIRSASEVRRRA